MFRDLVKEFLSAEEVDTYSSADGLLDFMREVLPDDVRAVLRSADDGQERLERALTSINESNRGIARRKFVELGQLLSEVREAYDKYSEEIVRLQNYFRREKTEITGGFRPYINLRGVRAYPVKWLDDFRHLSADPAGGPVGRVGFGAGGAAAGIPAARRRGRKGHRSKAAEPGQLREAGI
ncbi:MAG: hypothetical protein WKG07_32635 [Hymenobacter sp.]